MCSLFTWLKLLILNLCYRRYIESLQIEQMSIILKYRCFYSSTNTSQNSQIFIKKMQGTWKEKKLVDIKKTLKEAQEKWKQERQGKSNMCNKRLYSYFCIWKNLYFVQKHSLEKPSLYHYICSVAFWVAQEIWNTIMRHLHPNRFAFVL